jgi:hypothetical protein
LKLAFATSSISCFALAAPPTIFSEVPAAGCSYSLGYSQAYYLQRFGMSPTERAIVLQGAMDAATGARLKYAFVTSVDKVDAKLGILSSAPIGRGWMPRLAEG